MLQHVRQLEIAVGIVRADILHCHPAAAGGRGVVPLRLALQDVALQPLDGQPDLLQRVFRLRQELLFKTYPVSPVREEQSQTVGLPRVLLAAVCSAVTKLFGVHGVFYKVCGKGVGGIDGFYERSSFDLYHEMALINPEHPNELCEELSRETGIPVVLMDANDLQRDQLGKSSTVPLTDEQIQDAMADNPSGQGDELTPFILIRPQQG